jgi:hypothetical protein
MHDYKHPTRRERDPDAVVGVVCAIAAAVFAVFLWMGAA